MSRHETNELMDILLKAQKASAIIRALNYSWIELPGCEVEALLSMSSEYADSVTEYLINLSGDNGEGSPAVGDRYTENDGGSVVIVRERTGDRLVYSYEKYPEASHGYRLRSFIREFTLLEVVHG